MHYWPTLTWDIVLYELSWPNLLMLFASASEEDIEESPEDRGLDALGL